MQREISSNHTSDWDEQRERLSAYLDGELDEGERAALQRHLPACEQCRRALDDLREVRALLRAMPAPALPRSFAIPTTGEVPMPLAAAANERAERGGRQLRARGGGVWSGALQAIGGFVAAAGVMLVLGSALMGGGSLSGTAASTTSNGAARPAAQGQQDQRGSTSSVYGSAQATSKQATPTKAVEATSTPTEATNTGTSHIWGQSAQPENMPVVPIGAGMVAGGAALFVAGRVTASKRKRGRA